MITIRRQTGLGGSVMGLSVYVDGEKVGVLANGETCSYPIGQNQVEVRVGQGFVKSSPISLQKGQTAVAKFSLLASIFSFLGMNAFYLELEPPFEDGKN